MELLLPPTALVVFVDDTGHERLVKDQPVYGLGGCAVLAGQIEHVLRAPWREVRRRVTGSPDTPLHAADFSLGVTGEQIQTVVQFFRDQHFARLGAILTFATELSDLMGPVPTIAKVLQQRIVQIASWTAFTELAVVFESSERADPLIQAAFQDFTLQEGSKSIPTTCYFMPKASTDPALEVSDFIMHAVGRQARHIHSGKTGFVPDFMAVFHDLDSRLVSFMSIDRVVANPQPLPPEECR